MVCDFFRLLLILDIESAMVAVSAVSAAMGACCRLECDVRRVCRVVSEFPRRLDGEVGGHIPYSAFPMKSHNVTACNCPHRRFYKRPYARFEMLARLSMAYLSNGLIALRQPLYYLENH